MSLRYHSNEKEGNGFCYLPRVKTERRFLLPVLLDLFPKMTVSSRIPGWAKRSPFTRWQGGLSLCRLPQVYGESCWVFVLPDMSHYLCTETAGAWCSLSVFALQGCLILGDRPNQGKRKKKMMGIMNLDVCPRLGNTWIICTEALVSLTPSKGITSRRYTCGYRSWYTE